MPRRKKLNTEVENSAGVIKYLTHQLAMQLVIAERQQCRILDKKERRKTADDLEYVAIQTRFHLENCTIPELVKMIETICGVHT